MKTPPRMELTDSSSSASDRLDLENTNTHTNAERLGFKSKLLPLIKPAFIVTSKVLENGKDSVRETEVSHLKQ